jgi:hypothetical protein
MSKGGGRPKWNKFCQFGSRHLPNIEIRGRGGPLFGGARGATTIFLVRASAPRLNWQNLFHQLSGWVRKYPSMFSARTIVAVYLLRLGVSVLSKSVRSVEAVEVF